MRWMTWRAESGRPYRLLPLPGGSHRVPLPPAFNQRQVLLVHLLKAGPDTTSRLIICSDMHLLRSKRQCYDAQIHNMKLSRNGDAVTMSGRALNQRILVTRSRARHPRTRAWIRTAAAPRRRFVAALSSISGMAWLYRANNSSRSMRFLAVLRTMYPRAYRWIGPGRYCSPRHKGCHLGRHEIKKRGFKMRVDDGAGNVCQALPLDGTTRLLLE